MENDWLNELKVSFDGSGIEGSSLYYLINEAIKQSKIDFPYFLHQAANGYGVYVSEGFSYSLDQDWDDPTSFDRVVFFMGDVEIFAMPIIDYLRLIEIAAQVYIKFFPHEKNRIDNCVDKIKARYGSV